ncbi:MAG: prepilin-type N-terminal cleavage/methylation domain-containing protein [Deltaproteobacteria bacterium]|nr:prepilin-type N-terminal cleavage/methylation domain-containing protein [Deltaproteobacteria bacterium]
MIDGRTEKGFTLIELSVTIVIVLIVLAVVATGVSNIVRSDLSTSANKVAAAVRYLYSLAALNNMSYRLVIDFQDNSYWGEAVTEKSGCKEFLLPSEEEKKFSLKSVIKAVKKEEDEGGQEGAEDAPAYGEFKDNLLIRKPLPNKIKFSSVVSLHQPEPASEGRAEIYFFPSGYVEKAYIYIAHEDSVYTVETVPLMGTARVHSGELDISDFYRE